MRFSLFVLGVFVPLISGGKGIHFSTNNRFCFHALKRSRQSTSLPPWPRSRSSWFSYTWVWVCSRGALGSGIGVSSASPSSSVWWRGCLTRFLSARLRTSGETLLGFPFSLLERALLGRDVPYVTGTCHPIPRNSPFLVFGGGGDAVKRGFDPAGLVCSTTSAK